MDSLILTRQTANQSVTVASVLVIAFVWEKSKTKFNKNFLTIEFRESFKPRRGRINCSLNDNGKWRWFGIQFPIKEN